MQPDNPYIGPTPPPSPTIPPPSQPINAQPQPDYSFLNQQPKKKGLKLPFGNSLVGRLTVILFMAFLVVILLIIIKNIVSPAAFNKSDYLFVVERQQEMLHILTTDITNSNSGQLSTADQDFVATATVSLTTAQSKTLEYMADYDYKVSSLQLEKVFDGSIDSQLKSAQSANNLDNAFKLEMQQQLSYYENDLKTAYNSTNASGGRTLLKEEYAEAKLLVVALNANA